MESPTVPTPPPRRPGPAGVHRLGLAAAALAAVATITGAAAVTGGVAPGPNASLSSTTQSTDPAAALIPVPEIVVHTIYAPAPQPTAAPELPVKVVVINKPSSGEGDDGREGEDD